MANNPLEGLFYCIKVDEQHPEESLNAFIKFIKEGDKDEVSHQFRRTLEGHPKMGVLNWLRQLEIFDANFFTATKPVPMLFVSLPQSDPPNPWALIAGFMDFVKEGPVALQLPSDGQVQFESRKELDDALSASRALFDAVPEDRRAAFKAALRGDVGTDLDAVVKEIEEATSARIRALFNA